MIFQLEEDQEAALLLAADFDEKLSSESPRWNGASVRSLRKAIRTKLWFLISKRTAVCVNCSIVRMIRQVRWRWISQTKPFRIDWSCCSMILNLINVSSIVLLQNVRLYTKISDFNEFFFILFIFLIRKRKATLRE